MIWDLKTLRAIRELRSITKATLYDVEHSEQRRHHFIEDMRERSGRNLMSAANVYGVDLNIMDIKFWEEPWKEREPMTGDDVAYIRVGARWYCTAGTVEFVGGPHDGDRMVFDHGRIGQEINLLMPPTDPIWEPIDGPPSMATITPVRVTYRLAGWNDKSRVWVYSPDRY